MIWTIVSLIGVWFAVHALYVAVMGAKAAIERGELTLYWYVMLAPAALVGVLLDFVFNYTFGFMFGQFPKPFLFSQTVQHHYNESMGWRADLAEFFARNLNVFDDHIKRR